MTGYGKAEVNGDDLSLILELRAVNSRYLDYSSKLPGFLSKFDYAANRVIKDECVRGRITLSVTIDFNGSLTNIPLLNKGLLTHYQKITGEAREIMGFDSDLSLQGYLALPDVIQMESSLSDEKLEKLFFQGLTEALAELNKMREDEGQFLHDDIRARLDQIRSNVEDIQILAEKERGESLKRHQTRITELMNGREIDDNRLYMEISILAGKLDIAEEITRLNSHNELFQRYLDSDNENPGKKMSFLLQEMGREINTIGSKTDVLEIIHIVVNIKDELEKIREQVQNIL